MQQLHLQDWMAEEDEEKTAPLRDLEEWTDIRKAMTG